MPILNIHFEFDRNIVVGSSFLYNLLIHQKSILANVYRYRVFRLQYSYSIYRFKLAIDLFITSLPDNRTITIKRINKVLFV